MIVSRSRSMLAQVMQQCLPLVPRCFVKQSPVRTIDAKPDLVASQQRTHTRERKSEVAQRFSMTRMDHVDRFRSFGNDRRAQFTVRDSGDSRKTRQLLSPQLLLVRTTLLDQ